MSQLYSPKTTGAHKIQKNTQSLPDQPNLNFVGNILTATNNPTTKATDIGIDTSNLFVNADITIVDGGNF